MKPRLVSSIMVCLLAAACNGDDQKPGKPGKTETTTEEEATSEETASETGGSTTTTSTTTETTTETTAGTETAGSTETTAGTETAGTETAGTETAGTETAGTETAGGMQGCMEVEAAYQALIDHVACNTDDQCHVLDGHCEIGLGGCWYVVNKETQQSDLDTLADTFEGFACMGPVCACAPPPANAKCDNGKCTAG